VSRNRFGQWMADFRWAMNVMHARRFRRHLLFSQRVKFDDAMRPSVEKRHPQHEPAIIAYPDAFYRVTVDDVIRAMRAAYEDAP